MTKPLTGIQTSTYNQGTVTMMIITHVPTGIQVSGTTTGSRTLLRTRLLDELRQKIGDRS